MTDAVKEAVEALGRDWQLFKQEVTREVAEAKAGRGTAELQAKIDRIDAALAASQKIAEQAVAEAKAANERAERLEAERDRLGATGANELKAAREEHRQAYLGWMRKSKDPEAIQALRAAEKKARDAETKGGQTGVQGSNSDAAGGYAVPELLLQPIIEQQQLMSPIRQYARVVPVGNGEVRFVLNKRGTSSGWVAETGSRSATKTPDFAEIRPTFGTLYAYAQATEESLNDLGFDVASFLAAQVGEEFAIAESTAFLTGNGSAKPTGMLNSAPVATNDGGSPERAKGVLEYVPLDPSASPAKTIQAIGLIELQYTLRSDYRANAVWAMNSATQGLVRRLRDTTGQFLWQPSLQAGQPATLLGSPVSTWEQLADAGTLNALAVLYGDFSRGYVICDVAGLRTTVDDNITTPGYVKWYWRKRLGGILIDNYAIKVGKCRAD